MRKLTKIITAIAAMSLASCSFEKIQNENISNHGIQQNCIPGEMNIYLSEELTEKIEMDLANGSLTTKSSEFNSLVAHLGVTSMERVFPHAGKFEARTRESGLHRWYKVTFSATDTKAGEEFNTFPGVELAEPVFKIQQNSYFNDPQYSIQWNMYNDGGLHEKFVERADINVLPVWKHYTVGSKDVIVAVVDGGIDTKHEDLSGVVIDSYNFCTNTKEVEANEHATHIAGIIGAVNNNGKGVSSVAGGDAAKGKEGVKLLSAQIFENAAGLTKADDDERYTMDANAIKWGADMGAVISSNSWGIVYRSESDARFGSTPQIVKDAIDYFVKYAGIDENGNQTGPMKGGVVFFSSGNEGYRYGYPASYENCIAVGAIGPDGKRAPYSNYGSWVDICAPGGNFYVCGNVSAGTGGVAVDSDKRDWILSTYPDNTYGTSVGTSMACPHVSGVAALIISKYGGPGFTNEDLKARLLGGARYETVMKAEEIGPLVNAYGSMALGSSAAPDKVKDLNGMASFDNIDLEWSATGDKDDFIAYKYEVRLAKSKEELSKTEGDVKKYTVYGERKDVGEKISLSLKTLEEDVKYYVGIFCYDFSGNISELSNVIELETFSNSKPELIDELPIVKIGELGVSKSFDLNEYVTDKNGEELTYKIEASSKNIALVSLKESVVNCLSVAYGEVNVKVIASDERDSSEFEFKVIVKEGIEDVSGEIEAKVYPNPVVDVLNIAVEENVDANVTIHNAAGATVYEGFHYLKRKNATQLDLSNFAPGHYTLKLQSKDQSTTLPLIKL